MPITCIDIEGGKSDVTASAAAALGQRMADRHHMTIIHAETTDGEQYLTVEGIKVPGWLRSIGLIYPTPTRWQRIRAFPRYVLHYTGLRQAGIAEGPDIDAFSAGPA